MKIMISQRMNGLTEEQIRAARKKVVDYWESKGCEVVDTIFTSIPPKTKFESVYFLSKAVETISSVDMVCFMNGWEFTRGCKIEHEICKEYGIPTSYEFEL